VHLLGAAAALIVSAGWYVVLTMLWPSDSRPYMAGSTNNSFMNLVLGYNGFGRVLGNHGGGGAPPADCPQPAFVKEIRELIEHHHGGFAAFGGQPGLTRLFTGEWGFEISFLLPAALVALVIVLISRGRAPRTDPMRAGVIVFGVWMVVNGLVLAEMKQAAHPYYSLSFAPAVAGTFALGVAEMWRRRDTRGRAGLAVLVAAAGGWGFVLLSRESSFAPPVRWIVLVATVVAVVVTATPPRRLGGARSRTTVTAAGLVLATVAVLGGPAAYSVSAVATAHTGGSPTVSHDSFWATIFGGAHNTDKGGDHESDQGGFTGPFGSSEPNDDLDALLAKTNTRWAAAINGSSQAANLELNSRKSVMAMGGFTGQDPSPNLTQFQGYVRSHEVGYFIVAASGLGWGGGQSADEEDVNPECNVGWGRGNATTNRVTAWVQKYFTPVTVGGMTVYALTDPPAAAFTAQ
jgi:hypothetical protein